RRWPRRLLIGTSVFVAVCVIAAGAGYGYIRWRLDQINRRNLHQLAADKGAVMNVLLVGSDSRDNLQGADARQAGKGKVFGQRSDLGRIPRQEEVIRRVLRKAVSSGLTNPVQLNAVIGKGVKYVTVDNTLSSKDMLGIAKKFRTLSPEAVDMETLKTDAYIVHG